MIAGVSDLSFPKPYEPSGMLPPLACTCAVRPSSRAASLDRNLTFQQHPHSSYDSYKAWIYVSNLRSQPKARALQCQSDDEACYA